MGDMGAYVAEGFGYMFAACVTVWGLTLPWRLFRRLLGL